MEELTPIDILKRWATDPAQPAKVIKGAITDLLRIGVEDAYAIDVLLPIVTALKADDRFEIARWAVNMQRKIELTYKKDWRKTAGITDVAPVQ